MATFWCSLATSIREIFEILWVPMAGNSLVFSKRHYLDAVLLSRLACTWMCMKLGAIFAKPSKYPPAKPGALGFEPLEAAFGVADAAP